MKTTILLILLAPVTAFAGNYVGFSYSDSHQEIEEAAFANPTGERNMYAETRSEQYRLYFGRKSGMWLYEFGGGSLGRYWSHNQGNIPGRGEECCYIKQKIHTYHAYGAAGASLDVTRIVSVYGMAGYTFVWGKNHEYGSNENGPGVGHTNTVHNYAPIFMAGLSYKVAKNANMRMEYMSVKDVARSHWTLSSDFRLYGVGLQIGF